jgi:hypothetical protein
LQESAVGVKSDSERRQSRAELWWVVLESLRVFVQISQTFLVLGKTESNISLLESVGSSGLQVVDDLDNLESGDILTLVLREVFVRVSGAVGDLLGGLVVFLTSEFTTVNNDAFLVGLVVGAAGCVLDGANNALAAEDLSVDNVLSVKVGSGNGGDEELGAVGA